jgi:hypothetical protein
MDETRHHGGDEVNKEDETVMDDAQGSSTLCYTQQKQPNTHANTPKCSHTSYHNCDQAPTSAELHFRPSSSNHDLCWSV